MQMFTLGILNENYESDARHVVPVGSRSRDQNMPGGMMLTTFLLKGNWPGYSYL